MFCRKFRWPPIESIANQGTQTLAVRMFIETSGECASHWTTINQQNTRFTSNKPATRRPPCLYLSRRMPKICRVGRINGIHITCLSRVFLVRSRQSRSPFRWTRVTWVTKSLGSGEKRKRLPFCFLLDISLIFALMCFFLHFTPSLHFTFSLQSALIFTPGPESAFRSPQSSLYTDRYSDILFYRMFWYLPTVFSDCLPEWFQSKIAMFFDFREWSTIFHNFVSYCSVLFLCS